jgi:hypothetical protein
MEESDSLLLSRDQVDSLKAATVGIRMFMF